MGECLKRGPRAYYLLLLTGLYLLLCVAFSMGYLWGGSFAVSLSRSFLVGAMCIYGMCAAATWFVLEVRRGRSRRE